MTVMNAPQLLQQLVQLGFQPTGDAYTRDGLTARVESRWLTIQTQAAGEGPPTSEASGWLGLWKNVRDRSGRVQLVFDLPLATVTEQDVWDDETGDALCPLDEMITWASASRCGKLPAGWTCPPREELEASLPSKAFTLETGPFARQGQLCCAGNRLAVSLPLLQRVPTELSPLRRACLDQLLVEIQNGTRLVRFVEAETGGAVRGILAEVDLSGAPPFATPRLLRIGLDAVRHVVSQSISAAELLVDPTVTSTVWEFPSAQERPAEGSQK